MTRYVLGLDAGGTHSRAAIADELGNVIGFGSGGAGNPDGVGMETAQRSLRAAITQAMAAAGVATLEFVFAGLAGVVTPTDRCVAVEMLSDALPPGVPVEVDHDCRIALAGGLSGRPGAVLIAGTGASAFGRASSGREWRANGWGSAVGDEGSAYWIGVEGLRAAARARDGRSAPTKLGGLLLTSLGIDDADELPGRLSRGQFSRPDLAALAPIVVRAAEDGDTPSQSIIDRAVSELTQSLAAVARALASEEQLHEVVLVGGLTESEWFRGLLSASIREVLPASAVVGPELPPVLGGTLLALARLHAVDQTALPASVRAALRDSHRET